MSATVNAAVEAAVARAVGAAAVTLAFLCGTAAVGAEARLTRFGLDPNELGAGGPVTEGAGSVVTPDAMPAWRAISDHHPSRQPPPRRIRHRRCWR
jgi:hypothetical protein